MTSCGMVIAGLIFQSVWLGEFWCTIFLRSKWLKIDSTRKSLQNTPLWQSRLEYQTMIFHRLKGISSMTFSRFGSIMRKMIDTSTNLKSANHSISQARMTNSSLTSISLNLRDSRKATWRNGETIIMVDLPISSLLINSAEICSEDKPEHSARTRRLWKFQCRLLMIQRSWNAIETMKRRSSCFLLCTMRISTPPIGPSKSLKLE